MEVVNWALVLLGVILLSSTTLATHKDYKIYEVTPNTVEQAEFLHKLSYEKFDFWREGHYLGEPSDIMVAPEDQVYFESKLASHGLKFEIIVEDVERVLQEELFDRVFTRTALSPGEITFSSYLFLDEQIAYLHRLANDYPDTVSVYSIGKSYEERDIWMLKLSSGPAASGEAKPAIFIDAGIHCREWIAPPVAFYAIQELVENPENAYLYENVDWYIVPNLNPDGYEHTYRVDRLWRKNRRLTEGAACYGTDLNRNFGYQWMVGGASNNSCSEVYAGPEPFSEPEAQAIRDWFLENKENVKVYLSFHSFGELLLYPWSYAQIPADNSDELYELGLKSVTAIEEASEIGSNYYVNNSAIGLYIAAGVTTDWIKGEAGVALSYIFELPNGEAPYWFMLPARQIFPVVRETWAGIRVFGEHVIANFVQETDSVLGDNIIRNVPVA